MSFSVGIYDLFSYTIPGVFYLYLLGEYIRVFTGRMIPYDLGSLGQLVVVAVASFVVGVLVNPISRTLWHKLYRFRKIEVEYVVLQEIKERYPEVDLKFKGNQWPVIWAHMRRNHLELANLLDRSKAMSLMMSNISFGLFLWGCLQVIEFVAGEALWVGLLLAVLAWIFSIIALRLGLRFDKWYFLSVFEYAIADQFPLSRWVEIKAAKRGRKASSKNDLA